MPPNRPQYGLDELYLFPFYPDQKRYREAHNGQNPPWDPTRNVKRWIDPAPQGPGRNVTYARVLARDEKNRPVAGPDGRPHLEPLTIPKTEATTVNIPPDSHTGTADTGEVLPEYDCPLRELFPEEEIIFAPPMGSVEVRNTKLFQEATATPSERLLWEIQGSLRAIQRVQDELATKLDGIEARLLSIQKAQSK